MSGAACRLVDHALSVDWNRLPITTQAAARTFLHDTLCVGIAGSAAPNAEAVRRVAEGWAGQDGGAQVLGPSGLGLTAPYAAFVNAFQIHCQEYDCVHEPAVAHPMATVVAALLAETARSGPYDGATFLAALVAGVDVVATLGVAVVSPLKFFRPATAGVFGSTAALIRLRSLDRTTGLNAFGHALAFASGTMQAHVEGKPTLALQVAGAARSAIEALDLALAGIDGPQASIDGPFGYLTLFEDRLDLASALDALGARHRVEELSWKPFPTGRAAHGAIVALQQMMAQGLSPDTLDRFVYRAPPLIARLVGRPATDTMDPAYARLCFAYLGATVLLTGGVGLADFTAETLRAPDRLALARRLSVESDGSIDPAAFVPAQALAETIDGRTLEIAVCKQFGSPGWPLNRSQHFAKARACLRFAGGVFAERGADEEPLSFVVDAFEEVADVTAALAPAYG